MEQSFFFSRLLSVIIMTSSHSSHVLSAAEQTITEKETLKTYKSRLNKQLRKTSYTRTPLCEMRVMI